MNKYDWHTEPAFARPLSYNPNNGETYWDAHGISAWDYFAAAALTGMAANGSLMPNEAQELAERAANAADAMMLVRAQRVGSAYAESIKPASLVGNGQ